jgi:hypothetical protein
MVAAIMRGLSRVYHVGVSLDQPRPVRGAAMTVIFLILLGYSTPLYKRCGGLAERGCMGASPGPSAGDSANSPALQCLAAGSPGLRMS